MSFVSKLETFCGQFRSFETKSETKLYKVSLVSKLTYPYYVRVNEFRFLTGAGHGEGRKSANAGADDFLPTPVT